jgi:hypothetical protein
MAKLYEYCTKNVYDNKGDLYSMVDADALNEMALAGWELIQIVEGAGLQHKYTQAIFRREL